MVELKHKTAVNVAYANFAFGCQDGTPSTPLTSSHIKGAIPGKSSPSPRASHPAMPSTAQCLAASFSCLRPDAEVLVERLYALAVFRGLLGTATNALWTFFLFTKSDFKTIMLPIVASVLATCPDLRIENLAFSMFWTWLHLLQFCTSNQTLSVYEDAANKSWRPVPSGRISLASAKALRWWTVPLCLLLSHQKGALLPSMSLTVMTLMHNELGWHSGWFGRNLCCALGYMAFEWGAISLASSSGLQGISAQDQSNVIYAIGLSGVLLMTTVHTQDFKDVVGDRIHNRKTLPIVMPKASRIFILVAMTAWSLFLPTLWGVHPLVAILFAALGFLIGVLCYAFRSVKADQIMYLVYNFWLGLALMLPALGDRFA